MAGDCALLPISKGRSQYLCLVYPVLWAIHQLYIGMIIPLTHGRF